MVLAVSRHWSTKVMFAVKRWMQGFLVSYEQFCDLGMVSGTEIWDPLICTNTIQYVFYYGQNFKKKINYILQLKAEPAAKVVTFMSKQK